MKRLTACLLALPALLASLSSQAQSADVFPDRPIRLIVPVAAGGGVDTAFRTLAPYWAEQLGQPVVVENRPGAGQAIGIDAVAKSKPDGYTLAGVGVPIAFNTALGRKLPYDPVKDLTAVAEVVTQPLLVVAHPAVAAKNLRELIDAAPTQANPLAYTSGGPGSYGHLWFEMVASQYKLSRQHIGYLGEGNRFGIWAHGFLLKAFRLQSIYLFNYHFSEIFQIDKVAANCYICSK